MHGKALLAIVALTVSLSPWTASAESPVIECRPGELYPTTPNVPANLSAFMLSRTMIPFGLPPSIRFLQRSGTGDVERALDIAADPESSYRWFLTPIDPLEEGSTYLFVDETCASWPQTTQYMVYPAATFPTTLGVTTVSELRSARDYAGRPLRYFVRVRLELSDGARASSAFYEASLLIDSTRWWTWRPFEDMDRRVHVNCGSPEAIEPGVRSFHHEARLFGLDPTLVTEAVEATLRCDEAVRVHPATEVPLTPAEIEEMDRIPNAGFDAGAMDLDADAMDLDAGIALGMSGGRCGCRAIPSREAPGWLAMLVLVVAGSRRRTA